MLMRMQRLADGVETRVRLETSKPLLVVNIEENAEEEAWGEIRELPLSKPESHHPDLISGRREPNWRR
jgi:hypothetical protein